MAYTAAIVTSGGLPYRIIGAQKEAVADFTITTYTSSGEPVLNSDLGLSVVDSANATIQSVSGAGGTAVEAVWLDTGPKIKLNLATGADGAIGATNTVVRVVARGK
jgi:hypothetical protein